MGDGTLYVARDPLDLSHGVAPTNRLIEATFWDLHRFNQDGLIIETWNIVDGLAIMQQLKAGSA